MDVPQECSVLGLVRGRRLHEIPRKLVELHAQDINDVANETDGDASCELRVPSLLGQPARAGAGEPALVRTRPIAQAQAQSARTAPRASRADDG
jgi:hypothetical protein